MIKTKKITGDLFYSIMAVGMMNAVLQFIVYPVINFKIGAGPFGKMLFYLGVVSILAPSFGIAVNNTRLLLHERDKAKNKDFIYILCIFSLISVAVGLSISLFKENAAWDTLLFIYIIIITIFRNYSSVEFRLNLNYKKQFIFYLILSIGYLLGLLLFWMIPKWQIVYILGETAAVIFVVFLGKIYTNLNEFSDKKNIILKNSFTLALNYIITNLMLNLDRIVLLNYVGDEAVSQYYVLSLMGKTIAIISGPLNGILIGYLTKGERRIDKKDLAKVIGVMLGLGVIFFCGCALVTPAYIKIMYPNLYSSVISLNFIVNLSQIFYFLSGILVVIVLTVCSAKNILAVQIIYSSVFIVLALGLTNCWGIAGFSYAAVISNILYFTLVSLVGFIALGKNQTAI